ncbi:hypothetical protein PR048_033587 [Dryococelus australis]|uniref:PiggyBac transposable element-derived protein domain-containing protein n=1 Tax=Dryococelus australis TaxID=614101 RepID=A0ABQ9G0Q2_9NEOP|nr:hypothetical protein PR048_033587 [Dryococelus australis]
MYWEPSFRIPLICENLSINRFYKLRQNFHKVSPIYDCIRSRSLELEMEERLSIDEQMVPFKGTLNFKQYVRNKPIRWGVKILALGQLLLGCVSCFSTTILAHIDSSNGCTINREILQAFTSDTEMKKKPRGFVQEVVSSDGIILTKCNDNSYVVIGSNFVGIGQKDTCRRWDKKRKQFIILKD